MSGSIAESVVEQATGVAGRHRLAGRSRPRHRSAIEPTSYGKDGFIQVLTVYHRRAAVLAVDVVPFLHKASLDTQFDPISSHESWDRFGEQNVLIDAHVGPAVDADDGDTPPLRFMRPSGDELLLNMEVSCLLYEGN